MKMNLYYYNKSYKIIKNKRYEINKFNMYAFILIYIDFWFLYFNVDLRYEICKNSSLLIRNIILRY